MAGSMTAVEFQAEVLGFCGNQMGRTYSRIDDPYSTSMSGHNSARWASRGYSSASRVLETNEPYPGEELELYAHRILNKLREVKKQYREDADDEDGFATGAVGGVIDRAEQLLRGMEQKVDQG